MDKDACYQAFRVLLTRFKSRLKLTHANTLEKYQNQQRLSSTSSLEETEQEESRRAKDIDSARQFSKQQQRFKRQTKRVEDEERPAWNNSFNDINDDGQENGFDCHPSMINVKQGQGKTGLPIEDRPAWDDGASNNSHFEEKEYDDIMWDNRPGTMAIHHHEPFRPSSSRTKKKAPDRAAMAGIKTNQTTSNVNTNQLKEENKRLQQEIDSLQSLYNELIDFDKDSNDHDQEWNKRRMMFLKAQNIQLQRELQRLVQHKDGHAEIRTEFQTLLLSLQALVQQAKEDADEVRKKTLGKDINIEEESESTTWLFGIPNTLLQVL